MDIYSYYLFVDHVTVNLVLCGRQLKQLVPAAPGTIRIPLAGNNAWQSNAAPFSLTRTTALAAIAEHDAIGQAAVLQKYGFKPATKYLLWHGGKAYDSTAIAAAAFC